MGYGVDALDFKLLKDLRDHWTQRVTGQWFEV